MEMKSEAIVLSTQKIKDNATLVKLYTQESGFVPLLLYGAHSKRKGNSAAILHPLSIVHIEATVRNNKPLNVIKEIKQSAPTTELMFNPVKSSIAFFLAEVLLQVLRTNEHDDDLFKFLKNSILQLDQTEKGLGNFHILFLVTLSRFIGIQPSADEFEKGTYFDLLEAEFSANRPPHQQFLQLSETQAMQVLLRMNFTNYHLFKFTRNERNEVLNKIIDYYRIHTHGFPELKSIYVLREIFD